MGLLLGNWYGPYFKENNFLNQIDYVKSPFRYKVRKKIKKKEVLIK